MFEPRSWLAAKRLSTLELSLAPQPGDEIRLSGGAVAVVRMLSGRYVRHEVWTVETTAGAMIEVVPADQKEDSPCRWRELLRTQ